MKKNNKGFFLSETMVVIAIVAVVLLGVFKIFTSTYTNYKEKEKYNTVNAINAASTLKKYYLTADIDYTSIIGDDAYIELTNAVQYNSNYYNDLKEILKINSIYLINLKKIYEDSIIDSLNLTLRKYINTLKNYPSQYMIVVEVTGNEFASVSPIDGEGLTLVGDPDDEYAVTIIQGTNFVDPGYLNWNGDEPLTEWEEPFNANVSGTYYLHYDFEGYILRRKVIVKEPIYNYQYDEDIPYYIFEAPLTGYYKIELWGAQGGAFTANNINGGYGAYTKGTIKLDKDEKIYIYIGEEGNHTVNKFSYNGGGKVPFAQSFTGGGATDVRYFDSATPTTDELESDSPVGLNSRIMVAAGGGGAGNYGGSYTVGGNAGELIGYDGNYYGTSGRQGRAGTYIAGGASPGGSATAGGFGYGGTGGSYSSSSSGGGGSGYYGGSGGAYEGNSGGGGSSYISGYAGVISVESENDESTARLHLNNTTLHYSGKYFIAAKMHEGINSGNGKAKITWVSSEEPSRTNTDLNDVKYIRNCTRGSTTNTSNHPVELQAIYKGSNVAYHITPTNGTTLSSGSLITDGDINTASYATNGTGVQCFIVDLGTNPDPESENGLWDLDEVATWQYYGTAGRIFYDNYTSVSSDNLEWREVISTGSKVPTSQGERVNAWEDPLYTNLVRNGSFKNSAVYGWSTTNASITNSINGSITTNGLYINDTSTSGSYWSFYSYSFNTGDIYYAAIDNKTTSGTFDFCIREQDGSRGSKATTTSPSIDYEIYSLRFTGDSTDFGFQLGSSAANTSTSYTKNVRLYNLTLIYGSGNEPSIEWCDENLTSVYGILSNP